MNVYLAELKCPADHCRMAAAGEFESDDESIQMLPSRLLRQWEKDAGKQPKLRCCAFCGAEEFHMVLGRTMFQTLEEARAPLG